MKSIFAELPNNLIIDIIRIENDRKIEELLTKRKYREVIQELNKLSGRHCDVDEGYWYGRPWVRSRAYGIYINGAAVNDLLDELYDNI